MMTTATAYKGISQREARLADLLEQVRNLYNLKRGEGRLATEVCEVLDARCGIYTLRENDEGLNPCQLPAGHYGGCYSE